MIQLRPYQQKFIDDVRNEFLHKNKRVVGVAPCGAGKTIMTGWLTKQAIARGKRVIFFVHRQELIEQTSKTFAALDIPHGIIAAGVPELLELPVQIASVQTLARRLDKIPAPNFLICDECHHILANTYKKIIDKWNDAYLLGVTATPERMGGITLCDVFNSMVESLSVNELIQLGNLTKFRYFNIDSHVDVSKCRSRFGEYINSDLEKVMNAKTINVSIVDNYLARAKDKSAICYCVNVNHSKSVAQEFLDSGIPAAHVDGDTPTTLRESIVNDFRIGKLKVLCNAELFGEGFDVPNCQAVILARPTKSLSLFIQQSMRALRPDPNDPDKVAIILDHVQNCNTHGLPNTDRTWSLDPNKPKRQADGEPPVKTCPNCGVVVPAQVSTCPDCGYTFSKVENKNLVAGALNEIDVDFRANKSKSTVKRAARSPEDLLAIAKKKNYKIGWVAYKALEHANSYEDCLHIQKVCGYKRGWATHQWNDIKAKKKYRRLTVDTSPKNSWCP